MKDTIIDRKQKPTDILVWYDTDITIDGEKTEWYIVATYEPDFITGEFVLRRDLTVQPREHTTVMYMNKKNQNIQKLVNMDAEKWIPKTFKFNR